MADINILSIFLAVIASFIIGILWYSPLFFGKPWMKMMGYTKKSMENKKNNMAGTYLANFVATLVQAFVLANLIIVHGPKTIVDGMMVGFFAWLGFIAVTQLNIVLWSNKPFSLFLINTSGSFASMMLMSGIITFFII